MLWLVAGVTLLRIVYLIWFCPYTLVEDEAHYWEWSRRLDWSYYTKGPGIAWTIGAWTWMFGAAEWAIRLPGAIASGLTTLCVGLLAKRAFDSERAGFFAACAMLASPMFQSLGLMMTIDSPYAACWALAMLAAQRALGAGLAVQREPRYWVLVGAAVGVGTLYKYTMLLSLVGLVLAAWALSRGEGATNLRSRRAGWGWVVGGLCAALLAASPIVVWNVREGWPTVAHLLGHLGLAGGDMPVTQSVDAGFHYNPMWTINYIITQAALLGPVLAIAGLVIIKHWRTWWSDRGGAGGLFLVLNGLPILFFYLLVSVVAEPEGNWPLAGYITLVAIAGRGVDLYYSWSREVATLRGGVVARWVRLLWHAAVIIGCVLAVALPRLDWLARVPVVGRLVPAHRFMGADLMGQHVERLLKELSAGDGSAGTFVVALHYGRASQIAYYLPGRPTVYCASSLLLSGRRTQYDYWPDTDLRVQQGLLGQNAVALGGTEAAWLELFERVSLVGTLDGDGKKNRPAFLAYGFKGVPGEKGR